MSGIGMWQNLIKFSCSVKGLFFFFKFQGAIQTNQLNTVALCYKFIQILAIGNKDFYLNLIKYKMLSSLLSF